MISLPHSFPRTYASLSVAFRRPNILLIAVISLGLSGVLLGRQVLHGEFGIIDDHEIIWFLGDKTRLDWRDILPTVVNKTELGNPWGSGRFRPFYYIARVTETALWGDKPTLWYAARLAAFATFIGCVFWVAWQLTGFFTALVLVGYVSLLPFWSGIWDRLGPSEIYATVGLGIWLASTAAIFMNASVRGRHLVGLVASTFMLCGSKETLLPFAALSIAVLLLRRKEIGTKSWYFALATCLFPATAIAFFMFLQLSGTGKDIYGQSVNFHDRSALILQLFKLVTFPLIAVLA